MRLDAREAYPVGLNSSRRAFRAIPDRQRSPLVEPFSAVREALCHRAAWMRSPSFHFAMRSDRAIIGAS
jgi:hypothetical protein